MSVRYLALVLVIALLCWLAAGMAIVYSIQRAEEERTLIVRLVCQSVLIRERNADPLAHIYRSHYDNLLAGVGESCPRR